jgi:hypothetical protein
VFLVEGAELSEDIVWFCAAGVVEGFVAGECGEAESGELLRDFDAGGTWIDSPPAFGVGQFVEVVIALGEVIGDTHDGGP